MKNIYCTIFSIIMSGASLVERKLGSELTQWTLRLSFFKKWRERNCK